MIYDEHCCGLNHPVMCQDCVDTLREQRDDAQRILKDATEKAWQQGMADAAKLCIQNAELGNPEGWTDSVSRDCAKIITENITKNVAAMPNEKS